MRGRSGNRWAIQGGEEKGRIAALTSLREAAAKDWRAGAEWLRLSFPEDYSPKAEIKVDASTKVVVVQLTQERLKVLQEAHRRALSSSDAVLMTDGAR